MLQLTSIDVFYMTYEDKGTGSSLLTIDEVLGYLNVTSRTIYRLIRIGELPAVRIGRQWRIRRTDLDHWLDRQRTSVS